MRLRLLKKILEKTFILATMSAKQQDCQKATEIFPESLNNRRKPESFEIYQP